MNARKSSGFTLLEAMIVLVVVGAVAVISLDMLTGAAKAEARRQMVSQQAAEMATLNRAINEYVRTATGLPTNVGDIMEIPLADVIAAGGLPTRFAERAASGSTAPTSPIGQRYRAFIRRASTGNYEVVALPMGSVSPGFAARAGITTEPESLRTFNVAVMQEVRSKHTIPAGVIAPGGSLIDVAASGFELDLSGFLGGPVGESTVAALSNFAQLATIAAIEAEDSFVGKTCRFVTTAAGCEAGERTAIEYKMCERTGLDFAETSPVSEILVTPIGNIQISRVNSFTSQTSIYGFQLAPTTGLSAYVQNVNSTTCRHVPSGRLFACSPDSFNFGVIGLASLADLDASGQRVFQNPLTLWNPVTTFRELGTTQPRTTGTVTRGNNKPACGGTASVPAPTWNGTVTFDINSGPPSLPEVPVEFLALRSPQPGTGLVTASSHQESVTLPGAGTIWNTCEVNQLSNAATVSLSAVQGTTGSLTGVNTCALRSPPTNFQTFAGGGAQRPYERFQRRVAPADMTTVRLCCQ